MLDLHIAKTFDAATQKEPVVQIGADIHAAFFADRRRIIKNSPMLCRMADYYSDCEFAEREIPHLVNEIDSIQETNSSSSPYDSMMLVQLRDACDAAINNNERLFVICD